LGAVGHQGGGRLKKTHGRACTGEYEASQRGEVDEVKLKLPDKVEAGRVAGPRGALHGEFKGGSNMYCWARADRLRPMRMVWTEQNWNELEFTLIRWRKPHLKQVPRLPWIKWGSKVDEDRWHRQHFPGRTGEWPRNMHKRKRKRSACICGAGRKVFRNRRSGRWA
jgi:hypothetical protein